MPTRRQVLLALGLVAVVGLVAGVILLVTGPAGRGTEPLSGARIAAVELPSTAESLAISADGRTLYAGSMTGVVVIDVGAGDAPPRLARTIPLLGGGASHLALSPDGTTAYAATLIGVSAIDLATNLVTGSAAVRGSVDGVTVSPDGTRLYCPSFVENGIVVIDTATMTPGPVIPVAEITRGDVAVSPDGRRAFIGILDGIAVLDTTTSMRVGTIELGPSAWLLSSPDRRSLYARGITSAVSVVDTATNTVQRRMSLVGDADVLVVGRGSALHALSGRTLITVDTATGAPAPDVSLDLPPGHVTAFVVAPDGERGYVAVEDATSPQRRSTVVVVNL